MFNAKHIIIEYIQPSSIRHHGNKSTIGPFLKKGYQLKDERDGYCYLSHSTQILVTAYYGQRGCYTHNMKEGILNYYGEKRISAKLINQFYKDFEKGVLSVKVNKKGYVII